MTRLSRSPRGNQPGGRTLHIHLVVVGKGSHQRHPRADGSHQLEQQLSLHLQLQPMLLPPDFAIYLACTVHVRGSCSCALVPPTDPSTPTSCQQRDAHDAGQHVRRYDEDERGQQHQPGKPVEATAEPSSCRAREGHGRKQRHPQPKAMAPALPCMSRGGSERNTNGIVNTMARSSSR